MCKIYHVVRVQVMQELQVKLDQSDDRKAKLFLERLSPPLWSSGTTRLEPDRRLIRVRGSAGPRVRLPSPSRRHYPAIFTSGPLMVTVTTEAAGRRIGASWEGFDRFDLFCVRGHRSERRDWAGTRTGTFQNRIRVNFPWTHPLIIYKLTGHCFKNAHRNILEH